MKINESIIDTGSRKVNKIEGEYITIIHHDICKCVAYSVLEHYDIPDYKDTIMMLNIPILPGENMIDLSQFRWKIYYNFEHYITTLMPSMEGSRNWFNYLWSWILDSGFNEVWDFLAENINIYPGQIRDNIPVKFMPPRYTTLFDKYRKMRNNYFMIHGEPKYDLLFTGAYDNELRLAIMKELTDPYRDNIMNLPKIINLNGCPSFESMDIQANCRFVLDFPHYSLTEQTQNVLRIFEYLCLGNDIMAHVNPKFNNYFPGIIHEVYGDTPREFVDNLYDKVTKESSSGNSWKMYKKLTYSDIAYEKYRSMFEKSC